MRPRFQRRLAPLLLCMFTLLTLSACTGMRPGFETPTVSVTSFRMLPSSGLVPEFEIGLRVTNPNAQKLPLRGIAYTVSLDDRELIKGVSSQLPVIEGYGSGDVTLTAAPDLMAGARFFSSLLSSTRDEVSYELEAKLDVGALIPSIRVRETGNISLGTLTR